MIQRKNVLMFVWVNFYPCVLKNLLFLMGQYFRIRKRNLYYVSLFSNVGKHSMSHYKITKSIARLQEISGKHTFFDNVIHNDIRFKKRQNDHSC